ncbi:MAG: protoporphyrinogen oxidase [Acidimicrobiaceae bacterium]|nr:protoporphyrinogen oxidase [Acidimicrobiaceae bacterium]
MSVIYCHNVAVVGGGISGLACARRLSQQGVRVTIFEAAPVLGGQIRTATVAGHLVDMGAEAVHTAAPGMSALISELGLADELITSNPSISWLWTERGLRRLPAGVGPSGPQRLLPILNSRMMSIGGLIRAGLEPLVPRRDIGSDIAVGEFVSQRFGCQVVERFVDPVLGSLHSGDVNRLSLRATAPDLAAVADARSSVILKRRGRQNGPTMSFATWVNGLTTLVERLSADTRIEVRTSTSIDSVTPMSDGRYEIRSTDGLVTRADAVVLAVPTRIAAELIRPFSQNAAEMLGHVRYASVATAVVAYPRALITKVRALTGTGLLVPSSRHRLLKAATFLSTKWPHLIDPTYALVRFSSGRVGEQEIDNLDDAALVARLHNDMQDATGITVKPTEYHVQRWPAAIPQLEVGHLELVAKIRANLESHPGLTLAGASYDGLGIAACVRSGERAALSCLAVPSQPSG